MIEVWLTEFSIYEVNVVDGVFRRSARVPGSRDRNPQGSPNLFDGVWLELEDMGSPVTVVDVAGELCLRIRYKGSTVGLITSPLVHMVELS